MVFFLVRMFQHSNLEHLYLQFSWECLYIPSHSFIRQSVTSLNLQSYCFCHNMLFMFMFWKECISLFIGQYKNNGSVFCVTMDFISELILLDTLSLCKTPFFLSTHQYNWLDIPLPSMLLDICLVYALTKGSQLAYKLSTKCQFQFNPTKPRYNRKVTRQSSSINCVAISLQCLASFNSPDKSPNYYKVYR